MNMSRATQNYTILRKQLDDLGYTEPLPRDGIRLVDRLLNDIIKARDKICYYKTLSNCIENEREALLKGTQPSLSDNAKLKFEIDDLKDELIEVRQDAQNTNAKLRAKLKHLNYLNDKLESKSKLQQNTIQQLELELATQNTEVLKLKEQNTKKNFGRFNKFNPSDAEKSPKIKHNSNPEIMKLKNKCEELDKDVKNLLDNQQQQIDLLDSYKNLIQKKDEEIRKLSNFQENYRLFCSRKNNSGHNHNVLHDHVKNKYEKQLHEAIIKQNEFLIHNLKLVERNKQLENELQDIDKVALNVERQCNKSLENNKTVIQSMQHDLKASLRKNNALQEEILTLKRKHNDLLDELKVYKTKKLFSSQYVQTENAYTDHVRSSMLQDDNNYKKTTSLLFNTEPELNHTSFAPSTARSHDKVFYSHENNNEHDKYKFCKDKNFTMNACSFPHEVFHCSSADPRHTEHTFASWQKSYDKYLHKYVIKSSFCKNNCICNKCFHSINNLICCLDKKIDILQSELLQNQTEKNNLKKKLDLTMEMKACEQNKLQQKSIENQQKLDRLEFEQRELLMMKDHQNSAMNNLQEHCLELENRLSLQEKEISNNKISYNQLKVILDQTERTLTIIQEQLQEKEQLLAKSKSNNHDLELENKKLTESNRNLKFDLTNLKMILESTSKEKILHLNELDEKCEQMSKIKEQTLLLDSERQQLKNSIKDLKVKLDNALQSRDSLKALLTKSNIEAEKCSEDIEKLSSECKNYTVENRRLLDELTSVKSEYRQTVHALESSKKETIELQQQLQQYVARVRHAEDIIAMKETERSELLEQFRNLSQEALLLETNNHTLEINLADTQKQLHAKKGLANNLQAHVNVNQKGIDETHLEISSNHACLSTLSGGDNCKQSTQKTEEDFTLLLQKYDVLQKKKNELQHENTILQCDNKQIKLEMEELKTELDKEISAKEGLQGLLESCRREAVDYHLKVLELTNELSELRNTVQILMSKLEHERELSQRYQAQSHEYGLQLHEVREQIASRHNRSNDDTDFYTTI